MRNNRKGKLQPWRVAVFVLSCAFIVFLWARKDIAGIYATMPQEEIAPLVVTTVVVSIIKFLAVAGIALLVRCLIGRLKKQ